MSTPYNDQWSQSTKNLFEPLIELNSITTRMCSELARENLKAIHDLMQSSAEHMQGLSHVRGFEDVMSVQARAVANITPKVYQYSQQILDTVMEGISEYNKFFERSMFHAVKEAKTMQEKTYHEVKNMKHKHFEQK